MFVIQIKIIRDNTKKEKWKTVTTFIVINVESITIISFKNILD